MELFKIKELLLSTNPDDHKLACIIAVQEYTQDILFEYFNNMGLGCWHPEATCIIYKDRHILIDSRRLFIGSSPGHIGPQIGVGHWMYSYSINLD